VRGGAHLLLLLLENLEHRVHVLAQLGHLGLDACQFVAHRLVLLGAEG
jgi:hypothetical protein